MSVEMKPLEELVTELTPQARLELRDFAEFLWRQQKRATEQSLRQERAGALRDQREPYTALELKSKASDWQLIKGAPMTTAVQRNVVIQAGGRIELSDPQLPAGATAEVIVLFNLPLTEALQEAAPPLASLIGAAQGGFATPEEVDQFIKGETQEEAAMSVNMKPLEELLKELTPAARLELRDFAEFLWHKQMTPAAKDLGWPPGFFERFEGCLPDFPNIESEGDYEVRDELA